MSQNNVEGFRLSPQQRHVWSLQQVSAFPIYQVLSTISIKGNLSAEILERAFADVVRRHEPFRTHFLNVDGELRQIIKDDINIPLTEIDLTSFPETEREAEAKQLIRADAGRPFDLNSGPVIRTTLLRLSTQEHILLLTTHHIVSDAWSAVILFREFGELYEAFTNGRPASLAPLAIQYADFAEWQRD